jgi:hypothetical protein
MLPGLGDFYFVSLTYAGIVGVVVAYCGKCTVRGLLIQPRLIQPRRANHCGDKECMWMFHRYLLELER